MNDARATDLYRKYRPKKLEGLVGQDEVVRVLRSHLEADTLPHALLLMGPPGCGKTTTARILARYLCGHNSLAVHLVNAASQRGIDDVREIQRRVQTPAWGGTGRRVWILDECHQLSRKDNGDAQTALLNVLEDTPEHAYFFLCTTHPQGLRDTIRQRCLPLTFVKPGDKDLAALVQTVVRKEECELITDKVMERLLEVAASPRDALVKLDLLLHAGTEEAQLQLLAATDKIKEDAFILVKALVWERKKDWEEVIPLVAGVGEDVDQSFRFLVAANARKELLKPKSRCRDRAYLVLEVFSHAWHDEKPFDALVRCCWEVFSTS